ncbi:MAG: hypothetical protein PHT80_04670 [Lentisphaeria bacterium]|nr:hypothetical protein [Lentisphaeria bacterium]
MLTRLSALPLCLALLACCAELPVPTGDLALWAPHSDGGSAPAMSVVNDDLLQPVMRFAYTNKPGNNWGSASLKSFRVAPNATALTFELFVESATPAAAMHIWFFEGDGDAWMTRIVPADLKGIPAIQGQWRLVTVSLAQLSFQPRGNGKRAFLSTAHVVMNFNFGDQVIRLRNLRQIISTGPAAALPRQAIATPADPPGRRIAIFSDDAFPREPGHADAQRLAELLRRRGFQPIVVNANELAEEKTLAKGNIDLLILPQAPYFPREAAELFRNYLRQGGAFFSIGGYPFDTLLSYYGPGQWQPLPRAVAAAQIDTLSSSPAAFGLNTRYGQPGDTMKLSPYQIGVCDPSFILQHVHSLRLSPEQQLVSTTWESTGPLEGPAAVAMTGSNSPVFPRVQGRYLPLLQAQDVYGRNRGPVAAAVFNHGSPWNGSNWAFVTATNRNLFDGTQPALDELFVATCERLLAAAYVVHSDCDKPCARPGESVELTARFRIHESLQDGLSVQWLLDGKAIHEAAVSDITPIDSLPAYGAADQSATWTVPGDSTQDFHRFEVVLRRQGQVLDRVSNGLAVWQEESIKQGLSVSQQGNYFYLNDRPCFFTGTNTTGMMWFSDNENPLVWQQDFQGMRDYALNTLRILHFSPFCKVPGAHSHGPLDLRERPERTQRQTDAIVQVAQTKQVTVFLTLHDWQGLDLSDEELAVQQDWNAFWAGRYRDVPGIFYDTQNEPSTRLTNNEVLQPLFRQWLAEQYGSFAKAQEAWRQHGGADNIDFTAKASGWDDLRARDNEIFRAHIFRRWVAQNRDGVKAGDGDALNTVGYLQNLTSSDKYWGTQEQDFTNVHHYGALSNLRSVLKMMDRRYAGKSFSLGEFGSRVAHSARNAGQWGDPADASVKHFLAVGHCAFGMGAAFIANWSWKDFQDCVFPWGITHADLTAKPVLQAYRNFALLCRNAEPVYVAPKLYLLVPDGGRYGYRQNDIHEALRLAVDALLTLNVPFSVIHEWDLARLPKEATTLIWPMAYAAKDESFTLVRDFVRNGGQLLFSGDVRYGYNRQANRLERLEQLGILSSTMPVPFTDDGPAATKLVFSQDRKVAWLPGAFELNNIKVPNAIRDAYRDFLDSHSTVKRMVLNIDDGTVLASYVPLRNGQALTVVNMSPERRTIVVSAQDRTPEIAVAVAGDRTAFMMLNRDGAVIAAAAQGDVSVAGRQICHGEGDAAFVALDKFDLAQSRRILCLPFGAGNATLNRRGDAVGLSGAIGEFRNAQWTELAPCPATPAGKALIMNIDAVSAYDLRILAAADEQQRAIADLTAMLLLKPTP